MPSMQSLLLLLVLGTSAYGNPVASPQLIPRMVVPNLPLVIPHLPPLPTVAPPTPTLPKLVLPNVVGSILATEIPAIIGKIESTTLDCTSYASGGTPESCYNVCWYMNCYKGSNSFTCGGDADTHRKESGCSRNPCTSKDYKDKEPFKSFIAHGGTGDGKYIDNKPQCDEFPPASFQQGGHGARLRCISGKDNGRAGNKYKAMCKDYPKKNFSISFKNEGSIGFCKKSPDCTNDGGQYYLASPYSTKDYKLGRRDPISHPEYVAMDNEIHFGGMNMRSVPEPLHEFHNITRRNYRMSDDSTILLITRDPDHTFEIGSRHLQEDGRILTVVEEL